MVTYLNLYENIMKKKKKTCLRGKVWICNTCLKPPLFFFAYLLISYFIAHEDVDSGTIRSRTQPSINTLAQSVK